MPPGPDSAGLFEVCRELLEVKSCVFFILLAGGLAACRQEAAAPISSPAAPVATAADVATPSDEAIATEFLQLELSGWRLPDPSGNCRKELKLALLKAGDWGNYEGKLDVVEVGPGDPEPKIVSVTAADPEDPSLRKAIFEASIAGKKLSDFFVFVRHKDPTAQGWGSLRTPPVKAWIKKGCR